MSFGGPSSGIVVFDYSQWLIAYPEFGNVPMGKAQEFFNRATLMCDNTTTSPIQDLFTRTLLLNAATAHFAYLFTPQPDGNIRPFGRISQAGEGSVNASLEYVTPASATEAFWNQTAYGAYFWAASLPFRSARYYPGIRPGSFGFFPGRSRGFF